MSLSEDTEKRDTVHGTTRGLLGAKATFRETCVLFVEDGTERDMRKDGTEREMEFYMLLWSRHLAAVRNTIWKARDVIPTDSSIPSIVPSTLLVTSLSAGLRIF